MKTTTNFTGIWGKLAAGLSLCCLLALLAARAIPAPTLDLTGFDRLFATSVSCPAGCMFGIRPAATSLADAVATLQEHEWVGSVGSFQGSVFDREVMVPWRWSGEQPAFIDDRRPGILFARSYSGDSGHIVTRISISTNLRAYDLQRALGDPADSLAFHDPYTNSVNYTVSYRDDDNLASLNLVSDVTCPARLLHYWHTKATIRYSSGRLLLPYDSPQSLAALCEMASGG